MSLKWRQGYHGPDDPALHFANVSGLILLRFPVNALRCRHLRFSVGRAGAGYVVAFFHLIHRTRLVVLAVAIQEFGIAAVHHLPFEVPFCDGDGGRALVDHLDFALDVDYLRRLGLCAQVERQYHTEKDPETWT